MDTNNMDSSIKKKRMAVIVGIDNPIRIKSREYVLRKLFEKAKKNPFVEADNLDNMYKTLKRIGWLREISYSMFILITASQYAIS
jgi:hypothetical protein